MAPGLGLYLDEVFFEGYNAKQETEQQFVSKQIEKKEKNGKKSDAKIDGEGEERVRYIFDRFSFHRFLFFLKCFFVQSLGEVLKWSEEVSAIASMADFREGFIWPHIFHEVRLATKHKSSSKIFNIAFEYLKDKTIFLNYINNTYDNGVFRIETMSIFFTIWTT